MHRDGVADTLIILKIQHSGARFHLEAADLQRLQEAGVSPAVVGTMLATEDHGQAANDSGPYYYPIYPYYDPYGPTFYPRVFVGFDYYAYPHYFTHGPHFGPRPFPIVGPRYRVGYSGPVRRG
jgi:hypothetical protein